MAEYLAYYRIKGKEEQKEQEKLAKEAKLKNKQGQGQFAPKPRKGGKPKKRK